MVDNEILLKLAEANHEDLVDRINKLEKEADLLKKDAGIKLLNILELRKLVKDGKRSRSKL